jgi:S1-C subfamily serine protease
VVGKDGSIIADKNTVDRARGLSGVYADGTYPLTVVSYDDKEEFALLKPTSAPANDFTPVVLADSDVVRLGQSIIGITGQDKNMVSMGIVAGIGEKESPTDSTQKSIYSFDTSFSLASVSAGTPVINLNGEVVGMKVGDGTGSDLFKVSNVIKSFLSLPH